MNKQYIVKKGDSPWKIAKENGISLDEYKRLNPDKYDKLYVGDVVRLNPEQVTEQVDIRKERQKEYNLNKDNVSAIQGFKHDSNYAIVDKKNKLIKVYNKDNKLLYQSTGISTGLSGNDYNTVTYQGSGGIENFAGNNSTPAGILTVSGKGVYHGVPSLQRSRFNPETGKPYQVHPWVKGDDGKYKQDISKWVNDDVASSIHYGKTDKTHSSNGCIRADPNTLKNLDKLLGEGDRIYTLPEKNNSHFTLKGGRLNFIADNPYGNTEKGKISDKGHDMMTWDDYNTHIDKSYSPLKLKWRKTGNAEYDTNRKNFAQSIVNNKYKLQKYFNLTSDEYNRLADLALGIAEQETKFGTSKSYKLKQLAGEQGVALAKGFQQQLKPKYGWDLSKGWNLAGVAEFIRQPIYHTIANYVKGNNMAQSRGYTQIKNISDNEQLQNIYKQLGIDSKTIKNADKSAIATIARLAFIYNNEVKGRTFKNNDNDVIDPYHALMYKWNGHNEQLTNKTATPNKNKYIRNVTNNSRAFDMYETRTYNKYRFGGKLTLKQDY